MSTSVLMELTRSSWLIQVFSILILYLLILLLREGYWNLLWLGLCYFFLFFVSLIFEAVITCINVNNYYAFWIHSFIIIKWSLFFVTFCVLNSTLSDINIVILFLPAWYIFFHPFSFDIFVSLYLKWLRCKQQIVGSCFFIQSDNLCLLTGYLDHYISSGY